MYFEVEISCPANTAETDAREEDLELTIGVLTKVQVFTRKGQKEKLRLRIMDELTTVAPSRTPQYFAGNGEEHIWTGRYPLTKVEKQLKIEYWNTSTSYTHGCRVGLTVQAEDEADPYATLRDFIAVMKRLLGVV